MKKLSGVWTLFSGISFSWLALCPVWGFAVLVASGWWAWRSRLWVLPTCVFLCSEDLRRAQYTVCHPAVSSWEFSCVLLSSYEWGWLGVRLGVGALSRWIVSAGLASGGSSSGGCTLCWNPLLLASLWLTAELSDSWWSVGQVLLASSTCVISCHCLLHAMLHAVCWPLHSTHFGVGLGSKSFSMHAQVLCVFAQCPHLSSASH